MTNGRAGSDVASLGYERQFNRDKEQEKGEWALGMERQQETPMLLLSSKKGLEWLEIRPTPGPSSKKILKNVCVEFGGRNTIHQKHPLESGGNLQT